MSLRLGQLVYTSFSGVGAMSLASAEVPAKIQQAFLEQVVHQHWNSYNPPSAGSRLVYLHQLTPEDSLFGWLYNEGRDDWERSVVPYFICYYLAGVLHAIQLEAIFTCLHRGPVTLINRQSLPATLNLETLMIADAWRYQPVRMGVAIPADVRESSYLSLTQKRLLDLSVSIDGQGSVNAYTSKDPAQQVLPSDVSEVSSMAQSSPASNPSPDSSSFEPHPDQNEMLQESSHERLPESRDRAFATESLEPPQEHIAKSQQQGKWRLQAKATAWAIAISLLPVLAVGTATYLSSQSLHQQLKGAKLTNTKDWEKAELAIQEQLPSLLLATGVAALLAGASAVFLVNRSLRPLLKAAGVSATLVNRLRREEAGTRIRIAEEDELVALEKNLRLIQAQLPDLLWQQEAEAERAQVLQSITRRIWESLCEEEILRKTVEEVRQALRTDRVAIFRFEANWEGTFVEESAAPGLPKMLWSTLYDPCFKGGYIDQYRQGRVRAIDNIYQADLSDCHIELLERFVVKSNLIAPIIKDNQLFGLLIAHQCFSPRFWQQPEIALFTQLATQVGFALDCARLLEQADTKANQVQIAIELTRRIRASLNEEDILTTTVEEVRKAIKTDRAIVYSFEADWTGTVIAESVIAGLPRAIGARIKDPCFAQVHIKKYQSGQVRAIDDIYKADLSECHIEQLEPFAVKASLVAPILKDDQLFGLLIAHECSAPRNWQMAEINLFAQLAMQVGFALAQARLLQRLDAEGKQAQILADVVCRIQQSLNEEDILTTTVEAVRKAIKTDRAIVYSFEADWTGTAIAESVIAGLPKAIGARIKDPCFAEVYVKKYQAGRVQATNNIYEAGLSDCHIEQLEPFAVKANLVAPILKGDRLFGLLIAHECSAPREWQPYEIELFTQLARQVGLALDRARLLETVEQACQAAEAVSQEQRQQKEALQRQVSELSKNSKAVLETLSTKALSQMEFVVEAYNQIQAVVDSARNIAASAQQGELQVQQANQTVQVGHEAINQTVNTIVAIQETVGETDKKLKHLHQPCQKLSEIANLISLVLSQLKLQAMRATLEANRSPDTERGWASIAEKVNTLTQELDASLVEMQPLIGEIQTETQAVATAIASGTEQVVQGSQLAQEAQQKFYQLATISVQINALMEEIAQAAAKGSQTSTSASQSILEVASLTSQTSEQSLSMAESFAKLDF